MLLTAVVDVFSEGALAILPLARVSKFLLLLSTPTGRIRERLTNSFFLSYSYVFPILALVEFIL